MKKIILGLGTIAAIAAPVAAVMSCSIDGAGNVDSPNATLTNRKANELNKNLTDAIDRITKQLKRLK